MYNSRFVGVNPYYTIPPVQLGSGFPEAELFRGLRRQRGSGAFASFLATIARKLLPYAKSVVQPHATSALKGVVQDLVDGKSLKESAKTRGLSALKSMGRDMVGQSGSGRRRKRRLNIVQKKTKKTKKSKKQKRQVGAGARKKSGGRKKKATKIRFIRFKKSVLD